MSVRFIIAEVTPIAAKYFNTAASEVFVQLLVGLNAKVPIVQCAYTTPGSGATIMVDMKEAAALPVTIKLVDAASNSFASMTSQVNSTVPGSLDLELLGADEAPCAVVKLQWKKGAVEGDTAFDMNDNAFGDAHSDPGNVSQSSPMGADHMGEEFDDDNDLPTRLLPLFQAFTQRGTIDIDSLMTICERLGMECDIESLEAVIPSKHHKELYFDMCVDGVNKALLKIAKERNEDGTLHRKKSTSSLIDEDGTRKVGLFTYLRLKLCPNCWWDGFSPEAGAAGGDGAEEDHGAESKQQPKHDGTATSSGTATHEEILEEEQLHAMSAPVRIDWAGSVFSARNILFIMNLIIFFSASVFVIVYNSKAWLSSAMEDVNTRTIDLTKEVATAIRMASTAHVARSGTIASELMQGVAYTLDGMYKDSVRQWAVQYDAGLDNTNLILNARTKRWVRAYVDREKRGLQGVANVAQRATTISSSVWGEIFRRWRNEGSSQWSMHFLRGNAELVVDPRGGRYAAETEDCTMLAAIINKTNPALRPPQMDVLMDLSTVVGGQVRESSWAEPTYEPTVDRDIVVTTYVLEVWLPQHQTAACMVTTSMHLLHNEGTMNSLLVQPVEKMNTLQYLVAPRSTPQELGADPANVGGNGVQGPLLMGEYSVWVGHDRLTKSNMDDPSCNPSFTNCTWLVNNADRIYTSRLEVDAGMHYVETYFTGALGGDGRPATVTFHFMGSLHAVVAVVAPVDMTKKRFFRFVLDAINRGNIGGGAEWVVGGTNEMDVIVPQLTMYSLWDECLGHECTYQGPGAQAMTSTLGPGHESGFTIMPDYRPQPVVSSFAYAPSIAHGIANQADLHDLQNFSVAAVTRLIDALNHILPEGQEMQLLRYASVPVIATFRSTDPCPPSASCLERPGHGIVERSDCMQCAVYDAPPSTVPSLTFNPLAFDFPFISVTVVDQMAECEAFHGRGACNDLRTINADYVHQVLQSKATGEPHDFESTDYLDAPVKAVSCYLANYSTFIVYKQTLASLTDRINFSIEIASVVAGVLTVLGLLCLIFLTGRVMKLLDQEANATKDAVKTEKSKFTNSIRQLVPPQLIARFEDASQPLVSEYCSHAVVVNLDIAGYSDRSRSWNAKAHVRFTSYYFGTIMKLAERFGIFSLKMYGDVYVGIHNMGRVDEQQSAHNVLSVAQFAVIVHQLFSGEFSHGGLNDEKKLNRPTPTGDPSPTGRIPPFLLRAGIHMGALIGGFVNSSLTPRYDCHGSTLQIANRLSTTAGNGRTHISATFKDTLDNVDQHRLFTFETTRKTIDKNHNTFDSYVVLSAFVPVPEDFLARIAAVRSELPLLFPEEVQARSGSRTGTNRSSATGSRYSGDNRTARSGSSEAKSQML